MRPKDTLIFEAMKLPEADRLEVAEALYQSVEGPGDPDAEQAWSDEIARRLKSIDQGQSTLVPWDKARRQIMGADADEGTSG